LLSNLKKPEKEGIMKKRFYIMLALAMAAVLTASNCGAAPYVGMPTHDIRGFTRCLSDVEKDIIDAQALGANTLRLMLMIRDLVAYPYSNISPNFRIIPSKLAKIKVIVDLANTRGMRVILDVHEIPGYVRFSGPKDIRIWSNTAYGRACSNGLISLWKQLAVAFRGYPEYLVGFEILNEPDPKGDDDDPEIRGAEWDALQARVHAGIRIYDKLHTILISAPYPWRISSLVGWTPAPQMLDGRTALSIHFYEPLDFTQQIWAFWGSEEPRAYTGWFGEAIYEGRADLVFWDYWKIRQRLQVAADFQARFPDLPIVATEFSAMSIAPGADIWLSDVINVFRELWIGWTYHSFREAAYMGQYTGMVESPWDLEIRDSLRLEVIVNGMW
jgi:endoglucanase